jgi:hypothetical protein
MQRLIFDHISPLPPDRVFAHLAEHENLGPLFGAKVRRLKDGDDGHRNGVGSVRELRVAPFPPFEETITEFVGDELIRYRITKGSPLREHEGFMRFSPHGYGGTHVHYEIRFRGAVPGLGPLIALSLERNVDKGLPKVDQAA